jgi:hypothetical protein
MSPTRSGYKELGLDLVEPLRDQPRKPRRPPMGEEKKDEGAGDPIKMLLEEALEKQRNTMMDNFAQILQRIPTGGASTSKSHSGGATPFKVQVNFDIPIFDGQIDADVVDRWLNLLEGYFSVHEFSDREKIIFALLKATPHVKDWWETYSEQEGEGEPSLFSAAPTWNSFRDAIKEQYYPVGSYEDCYPRYLGITRRSCLEAHMVLDMEYREQERLEHGPGGPIFLFLSQLCPTSSTSFHHYRPGLASERALAP